MEGSVFMTKDQVLAILAAEKTYISGEKISSLLGISRAAVNTAVKALRKEGYIIASSTNRGYFLESSPDLLNAGSIGMYLDDERMKTVLVLDKIDSTNKKLREMAYEGVPDGQVVIADSQTGGRGRKGRSFSSPPNVGIYFSILLRPDMQPKDAVTITAWTAISIARAVQRVCGVNVGIKWVNDLILNTKKICGILTEMSIESESGNIDSIIIGIGINVNNKRSDFPPELADIATSLYIETGKSFSRAALAAAMVEEMDRMRDAWPEKKEEYLRAYREMNITTGKEISVITLGVEKAPAAAKAIAINDDFSLLVEYKDGTRENLSSGEVSIRGLSAPRNRGRR